MPRTARSLTESGYYHVTHRGDGRRFLFEKDADRCRFIDLLKKYADRYGIHVIAWCLMDNHVHILIDDEHEQLSLMIHDLALSYARYFNDVTGHKGSVFEDRFNSVPIRDERQLLYCVKYIHDNPVKANICSAEAYPWSSYSAYASEHQPSWMNTAPILDLLGGARGFVEFSRNERNDRYYMRRGRGIEPSDVMSAVRSALDGVNPATLAALPKEQRDASIVKLNEAGLTGSQIARATGLGRTTIYTAIRSRHFGDG